MTREFKMPAGKVKSPIAKFALLIIKIVSKFRFGQTLLTLSTLFTISQTRQTSIRNQKILFSFVSDTWLPRRFLNVENLEPDTLTWIDEMRPNSTLWDIGANVGGYSIYAAKSKAIHVFAFEPSPFNLEFLARNIWLNNLERNITVIPIALSEFASQAPFLMKRIEWAGSGSSFGEESNSDIESEMFSYSTIGIPADKIRETFNIQLPDYLKLDVDGIEALILAGAKEVLSKVLSVLVEVQHSDAEQLMIRSSLTIAGLRKQRTARHNEIWVRDE